MKARFILSPSCSPCESITNIRVSNAANIAGGGGLAKGIRANPDPRLRSSVMSGIHHEDPKNLKGDGAAPSSSVLEKSDRTPDRRSARSFVAFVLFVVSLGEDLGPTCRAGVNV